MRRAGGGASLPRTGVRGMTKLLDLSNQVKGKKSALMQADTISSSKSAQRAKTKTKSLGPLARGFLL